MDKDSRLHLFVDCKFFEKRKRNICGISQKSRQKYRNATSTKMELSVVHAISSKILVDLTLFEEPSEAEEDIDADCDEINSFFYKIFLSSIVICLQFVCRTASFPIHLSDSPEARMTTESSGALIFAPR